MSVPKKKRGKITSSPPRRRKERREAETQDSRSQHFMIYQIESGWTLSFLLCRKKFFLSCYLNKKRSILRSVLVNIQHSVGWSLSIPPFSFLFFTSGWFPNSTAWQAVRVRACRILRGHPAPFNCLPSSMPVNRWLTCVHTYDQHPM